MFIQGGKILSFHIIEGEFMPPLVICPLLVAAGIWITFVSFHSREWSGSSKGLPEFRHFNRLEFHLKSRMPMEHDGYLNGPSTHTYETCNAREDIHSSS